MLREFWFYHPAKKHAILQILNIKFVEGKQSQKCQLLEEYWHFNSIKLYDTAQIWSHFVLMKPK